MGTYDEALKAFHDGNVFAAIDFETTGLDPNLDRIAEIGAIKFDNKGIISRFSTLINPEIPMPPEAGKVNNLSDSMLEGKPLIEEAMPDFLYFLGNSIVMAHNAPFDLGFLNTALLQLHNRNLAEISSIPNLVVDTRILCKEIFPDLSSYSLQNLAIALKIELPENSHRAEDDALLCMELFLKCIHDAENGQ